MSKARSKVLLTSHLPPPVEDRLAAAYDLSIFSVERPMQPAELAEAATRYDAIVCNPADRLDASVFEGPALTLRAVANYGAGVEHIDLGAATRAGVVVTNTPDAVTEPTADLALMLMLMAMRRAAEGDRAIRAGAWQGWRPGYMVGQGLSGKLLGLVGFGRIGQATARRATAFGMRIGYFSRRRVALAVEAELNAVHYADLDALVAEADVLSLHVPGGAETRHLISARRLALMKASSVLINTARGSLVDEAALGKALGDNLISAAGLDVFEREPAVHPSLLPLGNVVMLPHLGSATIEARTSMGMQAADNLDAHFAGEPARDRVA